jgi:hypothetical protein
LVCTGIPEHAAEARQLVCEDGPDTTGAPDVGFDAYVTAGAMRERMLHKDLTVLRLVDPISSRAYDKTEQKSSHHIL